MINVDELKLGKNNKIFEDGYRIVYFYDSGNYSVGEFCKTIEGFMIGLAESNPIFDEDDVPAFVSNTDLLSRCLEYDEKAVNGLKPIEIAPCILTSKSEVTGVLVVSDLHYDSNYLLQGIYGEVVNKYDKEICRGRMSKLISMIEADDILMDDLLVVFNGDLLENAIRASSLIKLSQPVVDSTIELAEYLSNWLVALQDKVGVPMKVAVVGGNHSILRPLMSKPIDERENLEKIIHKFIELRLQNQSNIQVEPYGDVYFASLHQNNILFLHGEDADLENTIMYYENYNFNSWINHIY